jgi:hypothetical protein
VLDIAARNNFTVGQLAQYLGGYGGLQFVGTPASIADEMQAWLEGDARDGFNIMFPTLPAGLDEFVDMVVPELQGRGCSGRSMRARLCVSILVFRGRPTDSSQLEPSADTDSLSCFVRPIRAFFGGSRNDWRFSSALLRVVKLWFEKSKGYTLENLILVRLIT